MSDWWSALSLFDKTIWFITIPVTVIFLIQMVMTFAGMDGSGDIDPDFDGDLDSGNGGPFQLFTFRNFINFLLGFGWSVISLKESISNQFLLLVVSAVFGAVLVTIVMYIFYWMAGMSESGTMELRHAIGKSANVYLTVPAAKSGKGKVHIKIQGNIREIDAVTEGAAVLTGTQVRVVDTIDNQILLVEPAE